jgi:flagellum-specific ATP synthase
LDPITACGRVCQVLGVLIESEGPEAAVGDLCYIRRRSGERAIAAEVVGFRSDRVLLMPLGEMEGIPPGATVETTGSTLRVKVGTSMLGRVLDGLGRPIDGRGGFMAEREVSVNRQPPHPLERARIHRTMSVGVRAIDGLITCGRGQRVGIFAGSGVGKSTLLGMIARNTEADVNVIALIGERGREVREFIEKDLGEEGLRRSVVVVATSDQVAIARIKGALVATTIAEYFRDLGKDVLLMMDSVTRFAWAQRDLGLAVGEPPTTRGYTPSVFALLPRLLERSGTAQKGSITGLYTVLVDGDDMNEPVADAVRSILDGHIVLSRHLAQRNHYPAIDVLASVSRLMGDLTEPTHRDKAGQVRDLMATYHNSEELINIGAYAQGSNPKIDSAILHHESIGGFLRQNVEEPAPYDETLAKLASLG